MDYKDYLIKSGINKLVSPKGVTALGEVAVNLRSNNPKNKLKEKELQSREAESTRNYKNKKDKLDQEFRLRKLELKYRDKLDKRTKRNERYISRNELKKLKFKNKNMSIIVYDQEIRQFSVVEQREFDKASEIYKSRKQKSADDFRIQAAKAGYNPDNKKELNKFKAKVSNQKLRDARKQKIDDIKDISTNVIGTVATDGTAALAGNMVGGNKGKIVGHATSLAGTISRDYQNKKHNESKWYRKHSLGGLNPFHRRLELNNPHKMIKRHLALNESIK